MGGIAHEDDFAGQLSDPCDLAEDAAGVEHRLTDVHAVACAFVDHHALTKGVDVEVHDVADDEAIGHSGRVVPQGAQPQALGLERLVALQAKIGEPQLRFEFGLVGTQRIPGGDALAKPIPAFERTGDGHLDRVGDDRQEAADLAQMVVALVENNQPQCQQAIQDATEEQPRRSTGSVGITKCDHGRGVP